MRKLVIGIMTVLVLAGADQVARAGEAVGVGDFEFFLDSAVFRAADGTTRQEIYIRVPSVGVRFKEMAGKLEAKPSIRLQISDSNGKRVVDDKSDLSMIADRKQDTMSPLTFYTLARSYTLDEGFYRLSCRIEDKNAPKVTVMGMVQNKYEESVIKSYPLEVPSFPEDKFLLSDPKFLWSVGRPGDEKTYVPNPPRMYGLYKDSLQVFVEAYVPRSVAAEDLKIETVIVDQEDSTLTTSSVIIGADGSAGEGSPIATFPILFRKDLNRLTAGQYALYVNAGLKDQVLVRRLVGHFTVAWDLRTWETSRRDLLAEASFLLDEDDYRAFLQSSSGEREQIVRAMWEALDPDPTTGVNEARETYLERLAYVEARYADYQLGLYSDRGLVYLKYGAPDEKIVDVIPLNRETMSDAMQKIEDRFHAINFSNTGGRLGYATPQSIIVDPRRLGAVGEGGETAFPFELWIYNDSGAPIRKRDRNLEQDHGIRFIFVDREGYGRYRLESSSSMTNR